MRFGIESASAVFLRSSKVSLVAIICYICYIVKFFEMESLSMHENRNKKLC